MNSSKQTRTTGGTPVAPGGRAKSRRQLSRYAWSAKLPLSILTDREELSVYDCRSRPEHTDKASTGRILLLSYKEYVPRAGMKSPDVFGKAAVWQGALGQVRGGEGGQARHRGGRRRVPGRDRTLARAAGQQPGPAQPNPARPRRQLGRSADHRPHRVPAHLRGARLGNVRAVARAPQRRAHLRSGSRSSFAAPISVTTPGYSISRSKKTARKRPTPSPRAGHRRQSAQGDLGALLLLGALRFSGSRPPPGPCSTSGSGQGSASPGPQVKIEEKPEVRKAGGVFYTPTYIVDYIVQQTVGPLLEGKTPAQVGGTGGRGGGTAPYGFSTRRAVPAHSCWACTNSCWIGTWPST